MKVGINLRGLRPGEIGGHENYVRELVRWLPAIDPSVGLELFCTPHSAPTFDDSGATVHCRPNDELTELAPEVLTAFDLWFCPLMALEPMDCPVPSVVTIPDLQHESFPELFSPEELEWRHHWYGAAMQRADAVITVSRYSRQQMLRDYPLAGPRIHVIPEAAPAPFDTELDFDAGQLLEVRNRHGLPEDFLIYPANTWAHKNHNRLFEAIHLAAQELGADPALVLTGADSRPIHEWSSALDRLGISDSVHWLGYLPRSEQAALMAASRALVYPSLYEGFGLPVLEAMRAGTPVACSAAGSLPEVAGEAALLFDPTDPCSIACAIVEVWTDAALRDRLVAAGRRRVEDFSWPETARSTLRVFERAIEGKKDPIRITTAGDDARVGIVTPSLNQAPYIRSAIDSVLSQDDGGIDYLVMDGGSTDGTVDILHSYGDRVRWISEPDDGQSSAINRGWKMVEGEILTWINSDDGLAPGAVRVARRAFRENRGVGLVYGRGAILDQRGRITHQFDGTEPYSLWRLVHMLDFILQPASFISRQAAETVGWLREDLHYAMDWEFWIRLAIEAPVIHVPEVLGYSREYPETKTSTGGWRRIGELSRVTREHAGKRWTPGVRIYALETLALKLRKRLPPSTHDLLQKVIERMHNLTQRGLRVHADRWLGPDAPFLVPRSWKRARLVLETRQEHPGTPYAIEIRSGDECLASIEIPEAGLYEIEFDVPPRSDRTPTEVRIHTSWVAPSPPGDSRQLVLIPLEITGE